MDAPQPVAGPGHHHRIADGGQLRTQRGDPVLVRVQQILDLVAEFGAARFTHRLKRIATADHPRRLSGRLLNSRDDAGQRTEQHHQPAATRVDDPGAGQDGQLLRRMPQGLGGTGERRGYHRRQRCRRGHTTCSVGRRPSDRQDRALDRSRHRGICVTRGHLQAAAQPIAVASVDIRCAASIGLGNTVGQAAQDLRDDHAGIAPRAEDGPVGHRAQRAARGVCRVRAEGVSRRTHGQRQIGPRVTVRNRIDVQIVDLVLMGSEGCRGGEAPPAHRRGVQRFEHDVHPAPVISPVGRGYCPAPTVQAEFRSGKPRAVALPVQRGLQPPCQARFGRESGGLAGTFGSRSAARLD